MADTVARRIKRRRTALGLTQAEMAKRLGVHKQTYVRYEADGPNAIELSPGRLQVIARILGTTRAALLGDVAGGESPSLAHDRPVPNRENAVPEPSSGVIPGGLRRFVERAAQARGILMEELAVALGFESEANLLLALDGGLLTRTAHADLADALGVSELDLLSASYVGTRDELLWMLSRRPVRNEASGDVRVRNWFHPEHTHRDLILPAGANVALHEALLRLLRAGAAPSDVEWARLAMTNTANYPLSILRPQPDLEEIEAHALALLSGVERAVARRIASTHSIPAGQDNDSHPLQADVLGRAARAALEQGDMDIARPLVLSALRQRLHDAVAPESDEATRLTLQRIAGAVDAQVTQDIRVIDSPTELRRYLEDVVRYLRDALDHAYKGEQASIPFPPVPWPSRGEVAPERGWETQSAPASPSADRTERGKPAAGGRRKRRSG